MTYQLRDRPDGQIEIVVLRPETVGTFADRAIAEKVMTFLQEDDAFNGVRAAEEEPEGLFGARVEAEAALVVEEVLEELAPASPGPAMRPDDAAPVQLPAVLAPEKPRQPAQLTPPPGVLTEQQKDEAFQRLMAGEKMPDVARDFGVTFAQMRGLWTGYRRRMQQHYAGGGRVRCRQCQRPFMPSVTHPDTCARCSR